MPSSEVMSKFKHGQLHSGSKSGPTVKNRSQAIAIMLSEQRAEKAHGGKYPERADGGAATFAQRFPRGAMEGAGSDRGPSIDDAFSFPADSKSPLNDISRTEFALGRALRDKAKSMGGGYNMGGMPMGLGTPPMPIQPPVGQMGMPPMGMGRGYQMGGMPNLGSIFERQEARQLMHTGPIVSTVGGRTDQHAISVPSGSYVFPAAHVSALGQGNTINGLKVLQGMFGPSIHQPHGMGIPRAAAPRPMPMSNAPAKIPSSLSSAGGSHGHHVGKPVDIMAAGGEYVLGPDQVMKVGGGDLDKGHRILDHWVKKTHKKFAKTVANLPPPAKS